MEDVTVVVSLVFALYVAAGFGPAAGELPELTQPVNDFAHVIDSANAAAMDQMIRQLQVQVNDRTKRWGKTGEQAEDPQIKKELKDLGERQEKIETMINNMATKKNQ